MRSNDTNASGGDVLRFDANRLRRRDTTRHPAPAEREVVAVVTVTRFIGGDKVHAQVPVFADEILTSETTAEDLKLIPELSELLADGAVEANSYLDRLFASRAARPLRDFYRS